MASPAQYDFIWVRGTTTPLRMTFFVNGVSVPYDDIRLSVYAGKKLAFRLTVVDDQDASGDPGTIKENAVGDLSFIPTSAQTRALLQSAADGSPGKNSFEIEVRNGKSEEVFVYGTITAIGGLNDDEAA